MRALPALLALLVLAGCGGGSTDAGPTVAATTVEAAGPAALEDFRGEPVLVNVWSSW